MRTFLNIYRAGFGLLLMFLLAGCTAISPDGEPPKFNNAPPAPSIKAFSNGKYFMLLEDMVYFVEDADLTIVIPKGFVTDFASVPKALWSFGMSPHDRFSRAAIIHDYLYWAQGCSRSQADNIMLLAMKQSGVSLKKQLAMFQGVSLGGKASWDENMVDRLKLLPRIVPSEYMDIPASASWSEYETLLVEAGVRDPDFDDNPAYCSLGDCRHDDGNYIEHFNHLIGR